MGQKTEEWNRKKSSVLIIMAVVCIVVFGALLRFYDITKTDFFFFDEGFYLNMNRKSFQQIESYSPKNFEELRRIVSFFFARSLTTGKPLYLMLSDLRIFWGGMKDWYIPRVISAVCGVLTLFLTFLFARRFLISDKIALFSLAFLSVLPSHVFYSRLALQESLATLCFLSGFYLYVFTKGRNVKVFFSALAFAGAYFSNYRLLIAPLFVLFTEIYLSLSDKRVFDARKFIWHTVTFLAIVIGIGSLYKGSNMRFIFTWVFMQAGLAGQQHFDFLNIFSFPYYVFKLEGISFGLLFFGSIYYCWRRRLKRCFPFLIVLLGMAVFTFAADKGARYLCVFMPFMAMAAADFAVNVISEQKSKRLCQIVTCLVALAIASLLAKSIVIAGSSSSYKQAIEYLQAKDKNVKALATQPFVLNLFTERTDVIKLPHALARTAGLYTHGYRYLVVCPQRYISWTASGKKFDPELINFLRFVTNNFKPIATFPHLNPIVLERFVFEHNENLSQSISFLHSDHHRRGAILIYDLRPCMERIQGYQAAKRAPLKP